MAYRTDRGQDWSNPPAPVHTELPVDTAFTRMELPGQHSADSMPGGRELGLVRPSKVDPEHGWRKTIHDLSGGAINLGASAADMHMLGVAVQVNQALRGPYSIAVLSLKGGVGKTTTTVALGATFATLRGDRVVAVDANPDFGTLGQRGLKHPASTVRALLDDRRIARYSDVRRHTAQASSRLELLASERDPAVSEAFSEDEYLAVHAILNRFYNIILTDCGTGLTHSAMRGVLGTADAIVVVASPALDSVRSALATLDWLQHHGYGGLVSTATLALNSARPGAAAIDLGQLTAVLRSRVPSLITIPYDRHLAEGCEISLDLLSLDARRAYMELAANLAGSFGRSAMPVAQ